MAVAQGRNVFGIPNLTAPAQGGVGIALNMDFTNVNVVQGDLQQEQSSGVLDYVQSMYLDNSLNTKSISLVIGGTLQTITLKAGQQALLPVIPATGIFRWQATSTGAALLVPVIFSNLPFNPYLWQAV